MGTTHTLSRNLTPALGVQSGFTAETVDPGPMLRGKIRIRSMKKSARYSRIDLRLYTPEFEIVDENDDFQTYYLKMLVFVVILFVLALIFWFSQLLQILIY